MYHLGQYTRMIRILDNKTNLLSSYICMYARIPLPELHILDGDEGGLVSHTLGLLDRSRQRLQIVISILHRNGVPAIRLEARRNIFRERDLGVAVNGDLVVVVQHNEVVQLLRPGQRAWGCTRSFGMF